MPYREAAIHALPSEILLEIFSGVEYDPSLQTNLGQVSERFAEVASEHSSCIASNILDRQFSWARMQFPGIFDKYKPAPTSTPPSQMRGAEEQEKSNVLQTQQQPGWSDLATIYQRIATLTSIKARSKIIREGGHSEHSAWTTCRALIFHHTGLLLLYRLADCPSHSTKAALIRSLPKSSLAVVLFSLMVSVHLLRAMPAHTALSWIDGRQPMTDESRADIELASEELLLRDGPDFLLGLLTSDERHRQALKTEVLSMDERQIHHPTPRNTRSTTSTTPAQQLDGGEEGGEEEDNNRLTLIATLRRTFAAKIGCEMRYNLVHMWYELDESCADLTDPREWVARRAMEKVVNGEPLKRTCERCRLLRIYGY